MRTSFRYAVIGLLSLVLPPLAASAEETVDSSINEGSVLIRTRDVPSDSPADTQSSTDDDQAPTAESESLEPTSQSSGQSPQLANENEKDSSKFGAALAETQAEQSS